MNSKPLDHYFKTAIDELATIDGRVFYLSILMKNATKEIINNNLYSTGTLIGKGLGFRDVTLEKGLGNHFVPRNHYAISKDTAKSETEMILSRECLFQVAQSYELLESFLYNAVAEFISYKQPIEVLERLNTDNTSFESVRAKLKRMKDRTNNHHLLSILRDNIKQFKENETHNLYDFDFTTWYFLISEARHCITHRRTKITKQLSSLLEHPCNIYFNIIASEQVIFIQDHVCHELLKRIAEFIYLVYKTVSEVCYNDKVNLTSIYTLFETNQ
ncbi:hypothetical protein HDF19_08460 [Mucilaginibacter sp. E4BP6]|uniref:hypothetical protein n=1 Tax=Mucilaginibacter sp. E4BP6 TaxID=2723089 RepID=UPI0015C6EB23|nr:hypothetical protein [Mucilaginibacter sp. E4BP6]NYE68617.1 hypothetical protein [Mucilaginibacter sp. E4BP6]